MNEYRIIRNAPPPPPTQRKRRVYPFGELRIGDAFDVPDDAGTDQQGRSKRRKSVTSAAYEYRRLTNRRLRFTTRIIGDRVRCWRVA